MKVLAEASVGFWVGVGVFMAGIAVAAGTGLSKAGMQGILEGE